MGCQFGSRLQLAIWKVPAAATRAANMERHSPLRPLRPEAFFLEAGEELRLRAEGFLFLTVIRGRQALAAGRQVRDRRVLIRFLGILLCFHAPKCFQMP